MLLNNQWDHWRNQRGNKKVHRDKWKQKHNYRNSLGLIKSGSKREVYSDTNLSQEIRKPQINNLTLNLKLLGKEKMKPKVSRRKAIVKIRAKVNERETKKITKKINKTKLVLWKHQQNWSKLSPDSTRKKGPKSIKLKWKREKLQLTSHKYKELRDYMPIK